MQFHFRHPAEFSRGEVSLYSALSGAFALKTDSYGRMAMIRLILLGVRPDQRPWGQAATATGFPSDR